MTKTLLKVYVVDNGFVLDADFNLSEDLGRSLENDVFLELRRRGYDEEKSLFYYRSRNEKEVDFVIRRGTHVERLIHVSYDISNKRTCKREISVLTECAGEQHCENLLIITFDIEDTIHHKGHTIHILPFNKWQASKT